ncbi:transmembrane sensor [Pedobacter africanus]|uniref:Ferric-dicitrate binding protein FerR (Iron transport regulator) n=1 Tax=Pedobacter africanus TaxID=151894 RepID=A0ACC6L0E5_9SPHI|nr:FecR domain-containing protein [Pedobacter africanus]MDR6784977.1 ferric-dicitrate binding protein FerR (iron transport regulator) [Pedobacter africanus]
MSEQERALLIRYNAGQCTAAEKAAVEKWLFEFHNTTADLSAERIAEIKAEVFSQLPGPVVSTRKFSYWPGIAAAIALVLGFVYFFKAEYWPLGHHQPSGLSADKVLPGKNSATLTLANGKKIFLSDAHKGELATESGVVISKTADGQIIYQVSQAAPSAAATYNTLSTAKGETFQVRLPDGSLVVLNAASTLTYPTNLNRVNERKVELRGEAYFEVAKVMLQAEGKANLTKGKRKPFIVATDKQQVEVLGTQFNVNCYADEPDTKTTLAEGIVKVAALGVVKHESVLKPGQQALSRAEGFLVKDVNINQVIAWKNGTFDFDNEDIQSVMRKISRWYNVEVEFRGDVSGERFNGALSREKNIGQMLKMLESTGVVHFKIEGRRIIVIKN